MDLQLSVKSVPIITKVVSSNSTHGKVYSIQIYVTKFVSDLFLYIPYRIIFIVCKLCKGLTWINRWAIHTHVSVWFIISSNFNAVFLQNDHLYGLLMDNFILKRDLKEAQIPKISHIWKVYRFFSSLGQKPCALLSSLCVPCLSINRGHCGHDRMVVGFTTTYAISAYHHWCFEFESRSGVQHYVIKFGSDLWQVGGFLRVLRFPPSIKLTTTI
jgi:hypothetical protein